jgi:hypothetical protein
MDMQIHFAGGKRVFADYGGFTVKTDQPGQCGGDDSAPAPVFEISTVAG